ncbi:TonB-dependent siderophore receptor [Proteus sp. ZN5]|uniref:TonB-dependent siderophore receptor n=1 Tax=Proteus sp. ZN5 TaxID=2697019 RepID=UPI0013E1E424|nr:TonB-dependent siderophore receptor [Proteus sp. ZN5]QIG06150.1 TonB-dependent siderophore receptor [Proteus sp. ZN5]
MLPTTSQSWFIFGIIMLLLPQSTHYPNKQLKNYWKCGYSFVLPILMSLSAVSTSFASENIEKIIVTSVPNSQSDAQPYGYIAKKQTTATKSDATLLEAPQMVSVVNRTQLDNLPSESISQALRYSSGVVSEKFGAFGSGIDYSKMRGFDADYYLDGLRMLGNSGIWAPQVDSWSLESLEAVHGPASALYGQGGAGGVINMTSRRPSAQTQHQVQLQAGNNKNHAIKFDTTSAINEDETWLYHVSGLALEQESQIPSSRQTRFLISPAITWKPNDQLNWTILGQYQKEPRLGYYNTLPAQALGLLPNPNGKVDPNRNYNNQSHDNSHRKQQSLTSLFEYELTPQWQFKQNTRFMKVDTEISRDYTRGFLPGDRLLTAVYQEAPSKSETWVTDTQLIGKIATWDINHTVMTGFDYQHGYMTKDWWGSQTVSFDPWASHHKPDFEPYPVSRTSIKQQFDRYGYYLQDHLRWQQWNLLLSGRYDSANLDTHNQISGVTNSSHNTAWSHRVGLSYQFNNGFSPWISTSDSFDPVLGTDADGKAFIPMKSKQYEAGIKYQNPELTQLVSVAVYQLTQENVTTHNPRNPDYYQQSGEIRSRGLEFESKLALTPQVNMMLNYAYLHNIVTSTSDPTTLNKHPVQVPTHTGSAWIDYRFHQPYLEGALLGAGVRYLGSTYGDNTNTFQVPAVWLGDVSFRYQLLSINRELQGLELGLTVSNITNKSYVASCTSSTYCSIGTDRVVLGVLNYYF